MFKAHAMLCSRTHKFQNHQTISTQTFSSLCNEVISFTPVHNQLHGFCLTIDKAFVKTLANLPAKMQTIGKIFVLYANLKREKKQCKNDTTKPFYFILKHNKNKMRRTVKLHLYFETLAKSSSEYKYKTLKFLPWQWHRKSFEI